MGSEQIINWYPGHMTKAVRQMKEDIKLIDLIIEVLDARIPLSSRNPDIDELGKNRSRLVLLNKADLADEQINKEWISYFEDKGIFCLEINSKNKSGFAKIQEKVKEACKEKIERDKKRGIINRPVRAMVVGIPNVGKSTFINSYSGKAAAKTGNKPGVTKGKQWIRLSSGSGANIELLDTPGILWPKFEDQKVGLNLALTGSIKDELIVYTDLALDLIEFLQDRYQGLIQDNYGFDPDPDSVKILEQLAEARGCIKSGGELDLDRAAFLLLDDFRNSRLGNISLETCG